MALILNMLLTFSIKFQNGAFYVLFSKDDDEEVASWLHSRVKSLYFVTKSSVFQRSR